MRNIGGLAGLVALLACGCGGADGPPGFKGELGDLSDAQEGIAPPAPGGGDSSAGDGIDIAADSDEGAPPDVDTGADDAWGTVDVEAVDTADVADAVQPADGHEDLAADGAVDAVEPGDGDVSPEETQQDAEVQPPCSPALSIQPQSIWLAPLELAVFKGTGGTGAYAWELAENGSGATLSGLLGAYLAGAKSGAIDLVRLRDKGCEGEATAVVQVAAPLQVAPSKVELLPTATVVFALTGGSGVVQFSMVASGSGGEVDDAGVYTAGWVPGVDVVRVKDLTTGSQAEVVITVNPSAKLTSTPGVALVAVGAALPMTFSGGSGHYAVSVTHPAVANWDGAALVGVGSGQTAVLLSDEFTGMSATVSVKVASSAEPPSLRAGDRTLWTSLLAPGDLDGDGIDDLVAGHYEADISWFNDGAVYVWRGKAEGPPELVGVWPGLERRDYFGWSVAVADVVGPNALDSSPDGLPDLIVGAPGRDGASADIGAVEIYPGRPVSEGGFFADSPALVLLGKFASDQLGTSVAVCDFNGDGRPDLAVGGLGLEDRDLNPVPTNQGGVFVFLGFADGLLPEPQGSLWGKEPTAQGQWADAGGIQLGRNMAVGDFTGDGRCDLAVSSVSSNNGAVYVYAGEAPVPPGLGGLSKNPVRAWTGALPAIEVSSQLGRNLSSGDLNADGVADLAMSQHAHDAPGMNNLGAARVALGGFGVADSAVWLPSDAVDFTLEGDAANDQAGFSVAIVDVDGDGIGDLLAGHYNDISPVSNNRAGVVVVHRGELGALPSAVPWRLFGHNVDDGRFGAAVAAVAAVDSADAHVVAFAAFDANEGPNVGRLLFYPRAGADIEGRAELEFPAYAAGSQVGWRLDFASDWTGNGQPDLIVAAPLEDFADQGVNAGAVYVHEGQGGAFSKLPTATFVGFDRHSLDDRFGQDVASIGDFDGDGVEDLAVVARGEDKPGTLSTAVYSLDSACQGARTDCGAVYIFRGGQTGQAAITPDWIHFGPQASQLITALGRGPVDINGDGLADVVFSSNGWDAAGASNAGGVAAIFGRQDSVDGRIRVICAPDLFVLGVAQDDNLGRNGATALGDLDGDGCHEFAVGADLEDEGKSNQGGVWVFYGFGGSGCPEVPRVSHLMSDVANAHAGYAVASGSDVDGDGIWDLAVGAPNLAIAGVATGATWLLPGAWIKAQSPQPVPEGRLLASIPDALFNAPSAAGVWVVNGASPSERFGHSVALVPGWSGAGRAALAVGAPLGSIGKSPLSGGATIFRFDAATKSLVAAPIAAFSGETSRPAGRLGEWVSARQVGSEVLLGVGGYDASGAGIDDGGSFGYRLGVEP